MCGVNNRELATVSWLAVFAVWAISHRDVRGSIVPVLQSLISPKVAIPLLALGAWVSGLVYASARLGLWQPSLLGDTISWLGLTGLGLFGKATSVFNRNGSFRELIRAAVAVTVFVEVFVNLYVFPLPAELLLVPLAAALAMLSAVAGGKDGDYATVKKLIDGLLTILGLTLLAYTTIRLLTDLDQLKSDQFYRFLLPVWLTVGTLPFVALLGAYSNYDSAFSKIRWATDDRRRRMRARVALFMGLHLRLRDVGAFNLTSAKELTATDTLAEARTVVVSLRSSGA